MYLDPSTWLQLSGIIQLVVIMRRLQASPLTQKPFLIVALVYAVFVAQLGHGSNLHLHRCSSKGGFRPQDLPRGIRHLEESNVVGLARGLFL